MTSTLEVRAQLPEVVDGAVEDHAHTMIGGEHGLAAGRAEIEDGQPAVAQHRVSPGLDSFSIRTSTSEGTRHRADGASHRRVVESDHPCNPTHQRCREATTFPGSGPRGVAMMKEEDRRSGMPGRSLRPGIRARESAVIP